MRSKGQVALGGETFVSDTKTDEQIEIASEVASPSERSGMLTSSESSATVFSHCSGILLTRALRQY